MTENGKIAKIGDRYITPRIILMTDGVPEDKHKALRNLKIFDCATGGCSCCNVWASLEDCTLTFSSSNCLRWLWISLKAFTCAVLIWQQGVDAALLQGIAKATGGMYCIFSEVRELADFLSRQVFLLAFAQKFQHDLAQLSSLAALQQFLAEQGQVSHKQKSSI